MTLRSVWLSIEVEIIGAWVCALASVRRQNSNSQS
jgi:hypothetical protein